MIKNRLNIRYYGNPILKKTSSTIDKITEETKVLSAKMIEMMHEKNAVGLAAPQVGISQNLIVIDFSPDGAYKKYRFQDNPVAIFPDEALLLSQMPIVLINPEIISFGIEMLTIEEGCVSIPEISAPVTRASTIVLKAQMLSNEVINIHCASFLARVVQHEVDHLAGTLFVDRLSTDDYKTIKKKLEKLQKSRSY